MKRLVNLTLELEDNEIVDFEKWLAQYVKITSSKTLPDSKDLYTTDPFYKNWVKKRKADSIAMYNYIKNNT